MNKAIRIMTIVIGLNMVIFGAHQIVQPKRWRHYIPGWLQELLPVEPETAMRVHGSGNVSLGLWFMSGVLVNISAIFVAAWWAFILPFCGRVSWRAGVRDASILSAVIAIILLSNDRDEWYL
jgi:uncharacterized protein YjeT (DUF2065 family)